ncbi:hypothetical protein ACFORL_08500 [Legionella dresdenensis]|uniref:Substrate of the Dot/Icm secretion system n=1 Tax=Legionella dresdenensis TaxID=450200 RepID=A0ABV8CFL2_9GAMM
MTIKKQLQQLLQNYQQEPAVYSPKLEKRIIDMMQEEAKYISICLTDFINALKEDPPDILYEIIEALIRNRGNKLLISNLCYTRQPFLPINQLCLKIAEVIAHPGQPVCQMIMPGVTMRTRGSLSLKEATEKDGHFAPEKFRLSKDKNLTLNPESEPELDGDDSGLLGVLLSYKGGPYPFYDSLFCYIHSFNDLALFLFDPDVFERAFNRVSPRLRELVNVAGIDKLLSKCSSEKQQAIIDAKFDEIFSTYDTVEKFSVLLAVLDPAVGEKFTKKYASWLVHPVSECLKSYGEWKKMAQIQQVLVAPLSWYFTENTSLQRSTMIPELLKQTSPEVLNHFLAKFGPLITEKELFKQCLQLIQPPLYEHFFAAVPFASFITSVSKLQEILDLFNTDKLRRSIYTRFEHHQLKCTEHEFAAVKEDRFEVKAFKEWLESSGYEDTLDQLNLYSEHLAKQEEEAYSQLFFINIPRISAIEKRKRLCSGLINKLKNSYSPSERLEALMDAKKQLELIAVTKEPLLAIIAEVFDFLTVQRKSYYFLNLVHTAFKGNEPAPDHNRLHFQL